jgi:death-on-curing protein
VRSRANEGPKILTSLNAPAKFPAGIVQNHPFIDGNQRTGLVVGMLFLELNSNRFTVSEVAASLAGLELAAYTDKR